jgi:hypothetical protein
MMSPRWHNEIWHIRDWRQGFVIVVTFHIELGMELMPNRDLAVECKTTIPWSEMFRSVSF